MLRLTFPFLIGLLLVLPALLIASLTRRWYPRVWGVTALRSLLWSLPVLGLVCLGLGQWAPRWGYDPTQTPLTTLIFLSLAAQFALLLTLPVSLFVLKSGSRRRKPRPLSAKNAAIAEAEAEAETETMVESPPVPASETAGGVAAEAPQPGPADPGRRRFLQIAAAAVPVVATLGTTAGIAGTIDGPRCPLVRLEWNDLPGFLDGLRILHLSDLHLGLFTTLPQLATAIDRARVHRPDLVVVTGDIANDLNLLPAAMVMISELNAPLGIFSTLGNHEYGTNVEIVRDMLAVTPGTLLRNFGMPIQVGNGDLFLAGVDDPEGRPLGQSEEDYMRDAVDLALQRARPWMFTILLTHRPWVFDLAAARGVHLTLAGHTHGGQVGFAGFSPLELLPGRRYRYPRGLYRIGNRQLYTSAGAGHWLPFRLGCPAEAPVYELRKSEALAPDQV
ncbi:MAG: metallophosphoesterase [bacterium]